MTSLTRPDSYRNLTISFGPGFGSKMSGCLGDRSEAVFNLRLVPLVFYMKPPVSHVPGLDVVSRWHWRQPTQVPVVRLFGLYIPAGPLPSPFFHQAVRRCCTSTASPPTCTSQSRGPGRARASSSPTKSRSEIEWERGRSPSRTHTTAHQEH